METIDTYPLQDNMIHSKVTKEPSEILHPCTKKIRLFEQMEKQFLSIGNENKENNMEKEDENLLTDDNASHICELGSSNENGFTKDENDKGKEIESICVKEKMSESPHINKAKSEKGYEQIRNSHLKSSSKSEEKSNTSHSKRTDNKVGITKIENNCEDDLKENEEIVNNVDDEAEDQEMEGEDEHKEEENQTDIEEGEKAVKWEEEEVEELEEEEKEEQEEEDEEKENTDESDEENTRPFLKRKRYQLKDESTRSLIKEITPLRRSSRQVERKYYSEGVDDPELLGYLKKLEDHHRFNLGFKLPDESSYEEDFLGFKEDESRRDLLSERSKKRRYRRVQHRSSGAPVPALDVSQVTDDILSKVVTNVSRKVYSQSGSTCHQCRQKTTDTKTFCRSGNCTGVRGQFCGVCLLNRYGEDIVKALLNENWACPPCRDICNCSICRNRKGLPPTGIMTPLALTKGFESVKDYLQEAEKDLEFIEY
ncbi:cell division cycle-associated protein 7-like [Diaphorina citri]|uniref:Cell division cycle-associated protein 7-like n=1 Tax=Diaphorina citri TaxID=121845 RepID=A0A3Q0IQH8_DIACI|nr:cell division cycle-associated protein 7-like [Diaphorina citri]